MMNTPGRNRRLEFLEKTKLPGRVQLADLLRERIADTLNFLERIVRDTPGDFLFGERLHDPRARLVSADLERIFALQFEECSDFSQDVGNFRFGHRNEITWAPRWRQNESPRLPDW